MSTSKHVFKFFRAIFFGISEKFQEKPTWGYTLFFAKLFTD